MTRGDILLGKYRVERVLGKGGMAVVVAARHLTLDQVVAIKTMSERALAFPDAVERFVREAQTAVRLRCDNVARVTDVGVLESGVPYMVMEYLDGVDLASVLHRHGALAMEDAVDFVLQTCVAMQEAHEAGIVHRDLKPSNLFLTRRADGGPLIKVLDFGISKVIYDPNTGSDGVSLTSTNDFGTMGSPPYMSPEQARSAKRVDARTDIWSLGVILYECTTGQLPFRADNAAETLAKIMYEEPELACHMASWVPRPLARIIARCLAKDPSERYQDVSELARALRPFATADGRRYADLLLGQIPGRKGSGTSNRLASFAEPDTEVDSSVIVHAPNRLDLSMLLARQPAPGAPSRGGNTTQVGSGELAVVAPGRRGHRMRVALAALAIVALGVVAASTIALTGRPKTGEWQNPVDTPRSGQPAANTVMPASVATPESDPAAATAVDAGVVEERAAAPRERPARRTKSSSSSRRRNDKSRAGRKSEKSSKSDSSAAKSRRDIDPFGTID